MELINYQEVKKKIIRLREQDVILDFAVAELYGVETREINQAVKTIPINSRRDMCLKLANRNLQICGQKI